MKFINRRKGFIYIFFAVIVVSAFVAIGGYVFVKKSGVLIVSTPTPTATTSSTIDTSGWKIYRNEKYGFEFKYPEKFVVSLALRDYLTVSEVGLKDSPELVFSPLRQRGANQTLGDFVHNYKGYYEEGSSSVQFQNESKTYINNKEVYIFNILYGSRYEKHYFFIKDNKDNDEGVDTFYTVYFDTENPHFMIFQQILSTFKFFDPQVQ